MVQDTVEKEEAEEEEDIVEEEGTTEVEVEVLDMVAETNTVALLKSIVVKLKEITTIPFS